MFAILPAGRLVQTNFQETQPGKFLCILEGANTVNHLAVFMTGAMPLPAGFGATVHLGFPAANGQVTDWKLMGFLTNEKPSAIFRLGGNRFGEMPLLVAQIGVGLEPLQVIQQQAATMPNPLGAASRFTLEEMGEFCRKMLGNFFHFASSFAVQVPDVTGRVQTIVPMETLQGWYANIERRMAVDPEWWRNLE